MTTIILLFWFVNKFLIFFTIAWTKLFVYIMFNNGCFLYLYHRILILEAKMAELKK